MFHWTNEILEREESKMNDTTWPAHKLVAENIYYTMTYIAKDKTAAINYLEDLLSHLQRVYEDKGFESCRTLLQKQVL